MENPFKKIKKATKDTITAAMLTAGVFTATEVHGAPGGEKNSGKPTIESVTSDHIEAGVSAKDLKSILKGYEPSPGSRSVADLAEQFENKTFILTEAKGETSIAAASAAERILNQKGKVSLQKFYKTENGKVSVVVLAVE